MTLDELRHGILLVSHHMEARGCSLSRVYLGYAQKDLIIRGIQHNEVADVTRLNDPHFMGLPVSWVNEREHIGFGYEIK